MDNNELRSQTTVVFPRPAGETSPEDAARAVDDLAHDDGWWEAHRCLLHKSQRGELTALAAVLGVGVTLAVCVAVSSGDYNLAGWVFGFVVLGCAASAFMRAFIRIKNRVNRN